MGVMASQITDISFVGSAVCSGAHQRKRQSSASLAFVTRKMFPFDDVIMISPLSNITLSHMKGGFVEQQYELYN